MVSYKINNKEAELARNDIPRYKYSLLYYISETVFERTENIKADEIMWAELLEAYFFDENGQLHFIPDGDKMRAVEFDPGNNPYVEKSYSLVDKYKDIGRSINIREYLDFDEQGQCFVAYTALFGIN